MSIFETYAEREYQTIILYHENHDSSCQYLSYECNYNCSSCSSSSGSSTWSATSTNPVNSRPYLVADTVFPFPDTNYDLNSFDYGNNYHQLELINEDSCSPNLIIDESVATQRSSPSESSDTVERFFDDTFTEEVSNLKFDLEQNTLVTIQCDSGISFTNADTYFDATPASKHEEPNQPVKPVNEKQNKKNLRSSRKCTEKAEANYLFQKIKGKLFPEKIWLLASDENFEPITWSSCGTAISIDLEKMKPYLKLITRSDKFASFLRQMHLYKFRKTCNFNNKKIRFDPNIHTYRCEHFYRDQYDQLCHITRH